MDLYTPLLCLALLGLFSFTWLYVSNLSLKSGDREEEQEEEWLLDRFLWFLHHLDHGKYSLTSTPNVTLINSRDLQHRAGWAGRGVRDRGGEGDGQQCRHSHLH